MRWCGRVLPTRGRYHCAHSGVTAFDLAVCLLACDSSPCGRRSRATDAESKPCEPTCRTCLWMHKVVQRTRNGGKVAQCNRMAMGRSLADEHSSCDNEALR